MQEQEKSAAEGKSKKQDKIIALDGKNLRTAERLYCITQEANRGHTTWKVSSFQTELSDKQSLYLGYEREGELIGYIGSTLVLDEASINNFAVLPAFQGKGIGSRLLGAWIGCCKEKGMASLFLEVRVSNQRAASLYRKQGFEKVTCRKNYYVDPVEDAFLFRLEMAGNQQQQDSEEKNG